MRLSSGSAACAALVFATAVAPATHAGVEFIEAPIIGGRLAGTNDFYATIAIVDAATGEANCTGTLVAPRVVVTAAHCLAIEDEESGQITGITDPSELLVVAGALDVSDATSDGTYAVAQVILHEGYPNESEPVDVPSGAGRYDDIAILVLAKDVSGLESALIPSVDQALAALDTASTVTISGYGATSAETDETGVLYIAEISFALRADAEIVLGGPNQADTCPGDSGGPAYLLDGGKALLVGTTSRASENAVANCGDGGVYTFVPVYRDWIADRSGGLYVVGDTPVDPIDPVDPGENDETDELDSDDGGCAGGSSTSAALVALALLGSNALRRRRASARR